ARRGFESLRPQCDHHGIEVLAAAHSALNRGGDGSSPSGPAEGKMHWSFSGEDTALVTRQRGFESHPVLFIARSRTVAIKQSFARCTICSLTIRQRLNAP